MKVNNQRIYDLRELEGYFQCIKTPEETVAKINEVIVHFTRWFLTIDDTEFEVIYLKDCVDFLLGLREAIEEVTTINGGN